MYCINCGVKLADTEKQCPLCGVRVFHPELTQPEGQRPYPAERYPAVQSRSLLPQIILTALFLQAAIIVLLCDLQVDQAVTWSGYVMGALVLGYEIVILPMWFRRPNPVIFVPCGFAVMGAYLWYISFATGGSWFWTFALPVIGGVCLIVTAVVTLARYVRRGYLYIFGGAFILLGAFMLLVEFLTVITFGYPKFVGWSLYPMVSLVLLGGLLIFLAICRPARETMERKLFI